MPTKTKEKQVYNKIYTPEKWEKVNKVNKDIVDDFMQEMKAQKKSEGTLLQYKNDLRILCIYILENEDNQSILDLKKRAFRNFVIYATDTWGMSNARVNRLMSAIRMLTSFLEDDEDEYEDYDRSAAAKIKGLPKDPVRDIVFIPDDLIGKLYQKLMDEKRYKEAQLCALLYDSGARRNEVAQCDRKSLQDGKDASKIVVGKRGKKFKLLFFRRTKEAFKEYEATRKDEIDLLFPSSDGTPAYEWIYNTVVGWRKDLFDISGKDYDINPHSFRHAFIENLSRNEHYLCKEMNLGAVSLDKIKTLVHHSDLSTTDSYRADHSDDDIEELFGIKLSED